MPGSSSLIRYERGSGLPGRSLTIVDFVPSRLAQDRERLRLADELGRARRAAIARICSPSSATSAFVASSWMKTSSSILLRTSFVFAVAARTTGMKTPSTSVVIRIVANAARLGAALRRSARSASLQEEAESHGYGSRRARPLGGGRRTRRSTRPAGRGPERSSRTMRPSLELDHAAAHAVDHLAVVRGDDHGRAGAVHAVQQLHDPDRGLGVEVAGRLVRQQQRRVVDERPRKRDALLLAAGELVGIGVELGREADEAQDLGHLAPDLRARLADHLKAVGDVVVDGAVRQQLVVLEDDADVAPQLRAPSSAAACRCRGRRSAASPRPPRPPSSAAG